MTRKTDGLVHSKCGREREGQSGLLWLLPVTPISRCLGLGQGSHPGSQSSLTSPPIPRSTRLVEGLCPLASQTGYGHPSDWQLLRARLLDHPAPQTPEGRRETLRVELVSPSLT